MTNIFMTVLNMSVTAAFVIAVLSLARFVLKRLHAPKWISYVLWAVAGFRLTVPFTLESTLSLIPFKTEPFKNASIYLVTLHEQMHIKRHDHLVKLFAFALLCVHWFNPLVWVAFALLCADMEMSCDERVLRELGTDVKADYSQPSEAVDEQANLKCVAACLRRGRYQGEGEKCAEFPKAFAGNNRYSRRARRRFECWVCRESDSF